MMHIFMQPETWWDWTWRGLVGFVVLVWVVGVMERLP